MNNPTPIRIISAFILLFISCFSYSQQTEFRANAYSGLFSFRGTGATSTSVVRAGDMGYYNPTSYGKKNGFSYTLELQAQRVTKRKHLFGLGISYEKLQSKASVDSIYTDMGGFPEKGSVLMTNTFITANPYIGQRFIVKKITLDAQLGVDLSINTKVKEEAKVTLIKNTFTITKKDHPVDIRPRVQLNTYYKQFGFLIGYSLGTENFYDYDHPYYINKKAFANYLRLGISYKIK